MPRSAGITDSIAINDTDPAALIATVAASHRLESILLARRLAAVVVLLRPRVSRSREIDPQ